MLSGCEDAGGLCMCVPGRGVQPAAALEGHTSFLSREDGGIRVARPLRQLPCRA